MEARAVVEAALQRMIDEQRQRLLATSTIHRSAHRLRYCFWRLAIGIVPEPDHA
ncbi:MAG TPA: hypothetical protein VFX59_23360 [Polyangiales bacterium]|nr:hypothetical protein [Polyangiales bacterium]